MRTIIKEVVTRSDLRKFVQFPNKMYKGHKYYVPTLESADMDLLDKDKNHSFEYCEGKYWLAYDESGKIVGRIAGIINHKYNELVGVKYARFGFLDFIDDQDVVDALFDTMESWAKEKGLEQLSGPLGFLEFDAAGILVEGFDEYPTAYGKYNYPYYAKYLEARGYTKEVDWVEYDVTPPEVIPDKYMRLSDVVAQRYNLKVAKLRSKRDYYKYYNGVFDLMNRAYSKIHGYTELTKGQMEDLANQFVPLIPKDFLSFILNEKDEVIAFGICLPSMSKAMQKAGGRLFPFGWYHMLRAIKHNDTMDTLLIAIDDDYKQKGVNAMIFAEIAKAIKKYNIKHIETTRELEHNVNVQNLWNKFDRRLHKRARCYTKPV